MSDHRSPQILYNGSQQRYLVGDEIASGGEGSIHIVIDEPELTIKLYPSERQGRALSAAERLLELRKKVKVMLTRPPEIPFGLPRDVRHHYWAWPLEQLFTRNGDFSGYLMPKLSGVKGEEFLQFSSGFGWPSRFDAARNLARLVRATHETDYVIGDLNPRNLFFAPQAVTETSADSEFDEGMILPSIIDTGSFQVTGPNGRVLFPCRVQNPEYSAPELIDSGALARTPEQDYFTLAIVIFQLLSLGVHPFSGVLKSSVNQEIRRNIARGRNVLFSNELTPPRGMIDPSILPPEVYNLFERSFRKGHTLTKARANAEEWESTLTQVLSEELSVCGEDHTHVFSRHRPQCSWCEYTKRIGRNPFSPLTRPVPKPQTPRVINAADEGKVVSTRLPKRGAVRQTGSFTPEARDNTLFGISPKELISSGGPEPTSKNFHSAPVLTATALGKSTPPKSGALASNTPRPTRPRAKNILSKAYPLLLIVLALACLVQCGNPPPVAVVM